MLDFVRKNLRELRDDQPGQRFRNYHLRRQEHEASPARRTLLIGLAAALIAVGALLSVLPGPAFLFYIAAAAILAERFLVVAEFLDRAELALRRWWGKLRGR
jgi:hypothetical protein